jgi:uncharacterized protein (TIGR02246 family)
VCTFAALPHAQVASDEATIRAIVTAQPAAWNNGDADGFAKDVSPDLSFTNVFGMVMYGAPPFLDRQRQVLSTHNVDTKPPH